MYCWSYCYLNLSCIYYRCIQGMDSRSELVPVLGVLLVLLLLKPFMYILQVYTGYGFQVRACIRIGCTPKPYCYLNLSCCVYYRCIQGMDSRCDLVSVLGVLQVLLLPEPFMLCILQVYTGYGFQVRACTRIGCTPKSYCYLNLSCCVYYRCIQGMDSRCELVPVLGVLPSPTVT